MKVNRYLRVFCAVALTLALVISFIGFTSSPASSAPSRSKTVTLASSQNPRTLDPHNWNDVGTETTLKMMWESLIYTDRTGSGEYIPMLAESWDIAPDGMSWTFYLRRGVFWQNGDPFNADDVVYSFNRVDERRNELVYLIQYLASYDSVEKLDEYTVKLNFKEPTPMAGNGLRAFYVIPKNAHEEFGDDLFSLQMCPGTGPWKIVEWVTGSHSQFVKNENYWNKANFDSYFDEVFIRYVTDSNAGVMGHLAGDIDVYAPSGGINVDLLPMYAGTENRIELIQQETTQSSWITFQFKDNSIWNDFNVRRAFSMAIDRQLIIDALLGGAGNIPRGYFFRGVIGYDPTLEPYEYNPELARQLLAASAYDGRYLEIMANPNLMRAEDVLLAISDMVNSVGFNIGIRIVETTVFNERRANSDFDLFGMQASFIDGIPHRQYNLILNDTDNTNFVDEEINELVREFNREMSVARRAEIAVAVNRLLTEKLAPHVLLAHYVNTYARNYGIVCGQGRSLFYPDGTFNFAYADWDPSRLP